MVPGQNFILGRWCEPAAGGVYVKPNPFRHAERLGPFAASGEEDAARAAVAAAEAAAAWSTLPIAHRAAYLDRSADLLEERAEQIARDMTIEMGKPLRESRGEAARAAAILRFAAGEALRPVGEHYEQAVTGGRVSTHRRPVGVVALITPWNFPLAIPVWKLAPALVYGNTVVLKLAYEAPRTGLHLAAAFSDAGLPPGVLNVLTGRGSTVGATLVRDPHVDAVSFTGSSETGAWVRDEATPRGKRVQLELGGHNPLIVMADADLDRAAEAAYAGAFWSAGQKCTATRRIFVEARAYEAFRDRLLARVSRGRVGDPLDPQTEVGPLVNESQFEDVVTAVERGVAEGGTLVTSSRAEGDGYVVPPTIFEDVADDAFLSCEEVFGPVTSLYRFDKLDEALKRANAVPFGLSASIFTSSLETALMFEHSAEAGILHVNSQTAGADIHVPFGGIKGSGWGPHEQGRAAIEFYTDMITVYVDA